MLVDENGNAPFPGMLGYKQPQVMAQPQTQSQPQIRYGGMADGPGSQGNGPGITALQSRPIAQPQDQPQQRRQYPAGYQNFLKQFMQRHAQLQQNRPQGNTSVNQQQGNFPFPGVIQAANGGRAGYAMGGLGQQNWNIAQPMLNNQRPGQVRIGNFERNQINRINNPFSSQPRPSNPLINNQPRNNFNQPRNNPINPNRIDPGYNINPVSKLGPNDIMLQGGNIGLNQQQPVVMPQGGFNYNMLQNGINGQPIGQIPSLGPINNNYNPSGMMQQPAPGQIPPLGPINNNYSPGGLGDLINGQPITAQPYTGPINPLIDMVQPGSPYYNPLKTQSPIAAMATGGRVGYADGSQPQISQQQIAMAITMLKKGADLDTISSITGIPSQTIQTIISKVQQGIQQKAPGGISGLKTGGIPEIDYRDKGGYVPPIGKKERADDIPAMLSNNEFVFTANAVKNAGGGDVKAGAKKMYALMKKLEKGMA